MKDITGDLQKKLDIKNPMRVPRMTKIVVNAGVKDAVLDKKNIEKAEAILAQITGQKPKITKAKKAIASFKLRKGDEIGLMVTLRGKRMYSFFEKLVSIVLPRLRDFHGVKRESFDGHGNYTLGLSEYAVFPEVDLAKIDKMQGIELTIVTTAKSNIEGIALLEALGMPFKKQ
ncbi:MAG: 50S ribosomal protein L5 [Candidatus Levybacteria bacterium]|nr:50S ribosomal protein L5 [Candidatus Levybacteria bacterium]MBI2189986.1 50S ribosomal protein L5 [Candidatus Levybacteria bacterium]MBI2622596.1 50S ribosomal protein L5 [Candidatus Levybacteria bacterium]MBI3070264.1 50S ribosomal protein L5 [Candidatus Levybacteria bacterium]MBI3092991.1 50S ribosomal protein L5 [Candidatus Levybacteria bacterium]